MSFLKEKSEIEAERILLSLRNKSKRKEDLPKIIQNNVLSDIFGMCVCVC